MTERIRILIADDHAVVRHGLRALIATEPDLELVGEATDGVEAGQLAAALHPDVILLDMAMPRKTGLEAIYDIKRDDPQARILVLTSFAEDDQIFPAIKAGATGYLLKDTSPHELLQAIRDVERGDVSLHPTIARKLVGELKRPPDLPPAEEQLDRARGAGAGVGGARHVQPGDRRSVGDWRADRAHACQQHSEQAAPGESHAGRAVRAARRAGSSGDVAAHSDRVTHPGSIRSIRGVFVAGFTPSAD